MAVERHQVEVSDGTSIPVWVSGEGRPLLMVHGAISNHEAWDTLRPYLDSHMTVATMDRRVHLEDPTSPPYALDKEFDDISIVAQALGDEVDILGHSSGALCAMGAALQTPNLRRLVIYEPPMVAGTEPNPERMADIQQFPALLEAGDDDGLLDTFLGPNFAGDTIPPADSEPVRDEFLRFARTIPREMGAIGQCTTLAPEAFAGFDRRTLFLTGAETPSHSRNLLYREPLERLMLDLTVAEIPGQRHLANLYAPEVVANLVLEFLEAQAA